MSKQIADSLTMSPNDRFDALGELLDAFDTERWRVDTARGEAAEQAETEASLALVRDFEHRWGGEGTH